LASSLYALGRTPEPAFIDLLRLWSDTAFRAWVTSLVQDDPVLMSFFGWFNGLNPAERSFVLAAPMNKIRPLLQRASVRNVLGAPRATFTMAQALKEKLIVIVIVPEGVLGKDATTLIGQVVLARLWAAVQARSGRTFYPVTIDEAPRFLDQPTDLGEVLARSREYGVGMTLIGQGLRQFPERAPFVKLAFELAATGDYTMARLAKVLSERGLRMRPRVNRPAGPVSAKYLARVLRDRYYLGFVRYKDEEYQGRHEPLVSAELFAKVQAVVDERLPKQGSRQRQHYHY
jgi:hypothetical protein